MANGNKSVTKIILPFPTTSNKKINGPGEHLPYCGKKDKWKKQSQTLSFFLLTSRLYFFNFEPNSQVFSAVTSLVLILLTDERRKSNGLTGF